MPERQHKLWVSMGVGLASGALTLAVQHLSSLSEGYVVSLIQGVGMILIMPGLLCSALATNIHDSSLWLAAFLNFVLYMFLCRLATRLYVEWSVKGAKVKEL